MPAAILRIGTKIVTSAISAWKKTKTAGHIFSSVKGIFHSQFQRQQNEYQQQAIKQETVGERINSLFDTKPDLVFALLTVAVLLAVAFFFPGLAPLALIAI